MARKPKQLMIPGTEPKIIPEIQRAGEELEEVIDEISGWRIKVHDARIILEAAMAKHGLEEYDLGHKIVRINTKKKAILVPKKVPKEEDEE